ncbi:MAG: hypothetical protein EAX96_06550 [Candidatus Lokiarchaeota archaeon]|nr:hypothetical protein [Candidatus Lokiarchaeota archaeon]
MKFDLINKDGLKRIFKVFIKNIEKELKETEISKHLRHFIKLMNNPNKIEEYTKDNDWYSLTLKEFADSEFFDSSSDLYERLKSVIKSFNYPDIENSLNHLEKTNQNSIINLLNLIEDQIQSQNNAIKVISQAKGIDEFEFKRLGINITPVKRIAEYLFISPMKKSTEELTIKVRNFFHFRPEVTIFCYKCKSSITLNKNASSHRNKTTNFKCTSELIVKNKQVYCDECKHVAIMETGTCSNCRRKLFNVYPFLRFKMTDNDFRKTTDHIFFNLDKFSEKRRNMIEKMKTELDEGNIIVKIAGGNFEEFLGLSSKLFTKLFFQDYTESVNLLKRQLGNWYLLKGTASMNQKRSFVEFIPSPGGIVNLGHEIDDDYDKKLINLMDRRGYICSKKIPYIEKINSEEAE